MLDKQPDRDKRTSLQLMRTWMRYTISILWAQQDKRRRLCLPKCRCGWSTCASKSHTDCTAFVLWWPHAFFFFAYHLFSRCFAITPTRLKRNLIELAVASNVTLTIQNDFKRGACYGHVFEKLIFIFIFYSDSQICKINHIQYIVVVLQHTVCPLRSNNYYHSHNRHMQCLV